MGSRSVTPSLSRPTESQTLSHGLEEVSERDSIAEHLGVLLSQEDELYPTCQDYFATLQARASSTVAGNDQICELWRHKLCEWCFQVADHFTFDREVVSIALYYLDRTVSKRLESSTTSISKREFQLLAVTSLYLAIKIHGETDSMDGPRRKLKIGAFYELSRRQFNVDIIETCERNILWELDWRVNPPTTLKFVSTFLSLCPLWQETNELQSRGAVIGGIFDVARYLTELSVFYFAQTSTFKSSVVAFAAILCAFDAQISTLPPPYAARVCLLNNIAAATGLVAGDSEVIQACSMLKLICPSLFEGTFVYIPKAAAAADKDGAICGNTSPICVVDALDSQDCAKESSRRKRSRDADNEVWHVYPPTSV